MAEFTHQALADEIVNDPEGIGYKNTNDTWTGGPNPPKDDQVIANLINAKNLKIDRTMVEMDRIRGAIEFDWYDALSIDEQEYLRWQTPGGGGGVASEGGSWKVTADMKLRLTGRTLTANGVAGIGVDADGWWAAADDQDAAPAMLALIEIAGSRAEVLWDEGLSVTAGDVGRAANL